MTVRLIAPKPTGLEPATMALIRLVKRHQTNAFSSDADVTRFILVFCMYYLNPLAS
jgi:hypothetical protein